MSDNFKNLLKLLDDDNEQSASIAMAELLQQDDPRLERILRSLQETSDAKLRRRIHQLQSAIIKRRNRRQLGEALERNEVSLLEGILRLHLLWFDNDTRGEISDQWNDFLAEIGKRSCSTPRRLLLHLQKKFTCSPSFMEDMNADQICIGTILEDGFATDFMCCIIAKLAGEHFNMPFDVVRFQGEFVLLRDGTLYSPSHQWGEMPNPEPGIHIWRTEELLSLVSAMLFSCAVSSDSFRYIYTIGSCMLHNRSDLKFLPYPYGGTTNGGNA